MSRAFKHFPFPSAPSSLHSHHKSIPWVIFGPARCFFTSKMGLGYLQWEGVPPRGYLQWEGVGKLQKDEKNVPWMEDEASGDVLQSVPPLPLQMQLYNHSRGAGKEDKIDTRRICLIRILATLKLPNVAFKHIVPQLSFHSTFSICLCWSGTRSKH